MYTYNIKMCTTECEPLICFKVDARGIPREAELWSQVQSSITSQQSRSVLRDQLRACFQELESGKSYTFLQRFKSVDMT